MALDTYTGLKASIADWLNRPDLTAVIPDFIVLCEAEAKRRLRRAVVRADFVIDAKAKNAPADLLELRSMYLRTGSPINDKPMRLGTAETVAERRARSMGWRCWTM